MRGGEVLWQLPLPLHEWHAALGPCFLAVQGKERLCRGYKDQLRTAITDVISLTLEEGRSEMTVKIAWQICLLVLGVALTLQCP